MITVDMRGTGRSDPIIPPYNDRDHALDIAEIVSYEWGEYIRRAVNGEHDMMLFGAIPIVADPDDFLRSSWTCPPQVGQRL